MNDLVENVLSRFNSNVKVQWVSENEFKVMKEMQTGKQKNQPKTSKTPEWEARGEDFPQLSS